MLGCQDFCGHYDWTFAFLRQQYGQQAVIDLWSQAIGGESQNHYHLAALEKGLKGLYHTWVATGEDEQCDWTFTLDEERNVLRCDMRQCPSKGFLLQNDRAADEDYCDHCAGWIIPLLAKTGHHITGHQHNHAGQCWFEMAKKDQPSQSPASFPDIRTDPRWQQGYLDSWQNNHKLPLLPEVCNAADACAVLAKWFERFDQLQVMGRGPSARLMEPSPDAAVLVTDPTYATQDVYTGSPAAVLFGDRPLPEMLTKCAQRFHATPPSDRPLLLSAYLPRAHWPKWSSYNLPRPIPILPLLLREGLYTHQPHQPYPTTGTLLVLLAVALGKPTLATGIDLYQSGDDHAEPQPISEPHSLSCELTCLQQALLKSQGSLTLTGESHRLLRIGGSRED